MHLLHLWKQWQLVNPSISTKVGDAKNILGDTGWIIKVGDHKALAQHIEQIL